jgi:hypothetical protein
MSLQVILCLVAMRFRSLSLKTEGKYEKKIMKYNMKRFEISP